MMIKLTLMIMILLILTFTLLKDNVFNVPVANYPILQPLSLPLEDTITTSPGVPNTTDFTPQVPTHYNTPKVPSKPDPVLTSYLNPPVPTLDSPGHRRSLRATTQPKWLSDYVPK